MDPAPSADAVDAPKTTPADDPVETLKRVLQENSSRREFDQLLAPIEKHLRKRKRKRNCFLLLQAAAFFAVTTSGLVYYTPLYAHLRALGRIGLIKVMRITLKKKG